jgi:hypothetical protein
MQNDMIKSTFILLSLTLLMMCIELNAQRVGNENVKVAYNRLPDKPLSADFTTYSASVRTKYDDLSKSGLTPKGMVNKYFKLRAFKMLPAGGHFHINATIDRFTVESNETKTYETTTEDKEGNKKKVKQYYKEIVYRMPITMTLEDKDGNIIEQSVYNSPSEGVKYTFLNGKTRFNSVADMNKAWKNGTATYNKLRKEALEKAFTEFSTLVKDNYDTQEASSLVQLKVPKGKKVPGADQFEAQAKKAAGVLKLIKAGAALGAAKDDLQPMLEFWNTQKDNFSATDKKEGRIHHACLYNLATVNYRLDNFEEAKKYAEAAVATEQKKMVTKSLLDAIIQAQEKAQAQGVTTLHFPIDLSSAVGPEGADYTHLSEFEDIVIQAAPDRSVSHEGYYITTQRDSIRGTYVFRDGKDKKPKFYSGGNVKFHFEKDGEPIEWYISPEKFKRGYFNGRLFTVIKRKPSMSLKNLSYAAEVIADGPKMRLVKAFPMERRKDGEATVDQTLIEIKGQDGFANVGDVTIPRFINWRKGFAELFKDCEVLYAEIRVGEYKRDLKSIADAVNIYNQNDCE